MRCVFVFVAIALASGCVGSHWMRPQAFVPPLRHYRIRYDDVASRRVLAQGWHVLNHDGRDLLPGPRWWMDTTVELGGRSGAIRIHVPRFDLYAEHGLDGSTLFVRTLPAPPVLAERALDVIAHDIVSNVIGEGFIFVGDGRDQRQVLSSQIVEEGPAEVGGREAYLVTLQITVMGATRVGSAATCTFVLFRPGEWAWRRDGLADRDGLPMFVLAGYEADADRYGSHWNDFRDLLARLDVRPDP